MIWPENRAVPPAVLIVTLCGIAASALRKSIPNGRSAGAVSDAGAKRKSFASSSRTIGFAVGFGVGFAVGFGVGFAVGFGVGLAAGALVGSGLDVAGVDVGAAEGASVGAGEVVAPDDDRPGEAAGVDGPASEMDGLTRVSGDEVPSDPGTADGGVDPPQAATIKATAPSRARRNGDIAAL